MNIPNLPWMIALAAALLLAPVVTLLVLRGRKPSMPKALPNDWALSGRPVFSSDERRIYRSLREALPHHVILSKLPLVRFCQPNNPADVRYWYELLGANHVTFAVCSANGRVLAAIDLDADHGNSRRVLQIKQSVLSACRVRYLRCPADHLPSVAELQMLVPHSGAATTSRATPPTAQPPQTMNKARDTLANTVANRRAQRTTPAWQDSTQFQDSFFAPDSRLDAFMGSDFATLTERASPFIGDALDRDSVMPPNTGAANDIAGVVVDTPEPGTATRR